MSKVCPNKRTTFPIFFESVSDFECIMTEFLSYFDSFIHFIQSYTVDASFCAFAQSLSLQRCSTSLPHRIRRLTSFAIRFFVSVSLMTRKRDEVKTAEVELSMMAQRRCRRSRPTPYLQCVSDVFLTPLAYARNLIFLFESLLKSLFRSKQYGHLHRRRLGRACYSLRVQCRMSPSR